MNRRFILGIGFTVAFVNATGLAAPAPVAADLGVNGEKHWAYVKLVRPATPKVSRPEWVRNPIDAFVLARLEKEGLAPSPEADKETLIRRVSLDLTGLPPTLKELDAFLADAGSGAYERVVDRLLKSPRYGERWARLWLDLARYADSNGHDSDNPRVMWKFRDWVIEAFNRDLPFDQFTIEQMAGDMLPAATVEQKIASGFHANTLLNEEGGVDAGEANYQNLVDRVNTTAAVWLGTTLGCAQCHNHKYDPLSQKAYFAMLAFFDNTEAEVDYDPGSDYYLLRREPKLSLPTAEQESKLQALEQEMAEAQRVLETPTPELDAAQSKWETESRELLAGWQPLDLAEMAAASGAQFIREEDGSYFLMGPNTEADRYTALSRPALKGITAFRLEVLPDRRLPFSGPGRGSTGGFVLSEFKVQIEPDGPPVAFEKGEADAYLSGASAAEAIDGKDNTGWSASPGSAHYAVFAVKVPISNAQAALQISLEHESVHPHHSLGRFRLSATTAAEPLRTMKIPLMTQRLLVTDTNQRTETDRSAISKHYRSVAPLLEPTREKIKKLKSAIAARNIPTALVQKERPTFERPSTLLRIRGNFSNPGEKVYANVPPALNPLPESQPPNRLGLARWLVDPENPLTARVTVNRFWEQYFGRGLVETSEDFGTQGGRPTHPELLDWMALEFMERGWSMKAFHRLVVTSATYRQSSRVTSDLLEKDPFNRLYARGPRFRVEAEILRDISLAVSGQLSQKMGGPPVYPVQPEGIWQVSRSDAKWETSKGEDRYRRAIYTFLRRSAPYPLFTMFDGTSREVCTVRRIRTNTPLQALTLLNDMAFFEASQGLAKRMLTETEPTTRARARHGFRLCTAREPGPADLTDVLRLYEKARVWFAERGGAGKVLEGMSDIPAAEDAKTEWAAWTMVANGLLNLDETLTKE